MGTYYHNGRYYGYDDVPESGDESVDDYYRDVAELIAEDEYHDRKQGWEDC